MLAMLGPCMVVKKEVVIFFVGSVAVKKKVMESQDLNDSTVSSISA